MDITGTRLRAGSSPDFLGGDSFRTTGGGEREVMALDKWVEGESDEAKVLNGLQTIDMAKPAY
jgi:hypothetical protein